MHIGIVYQTCIPTRTVPSVQVCCKSRKIKVGKLGITSSVAIMGLKQLTSWTMVSTIHLWSGRKLETTHSTTMRTCRLKITLSYKTSYICNLKYSWQSITKIWFDLHSNLEQCLPNKYVYQPLFNVSRKKKKDL